MKNLYNKEYFENGVSEGVSCYLNYRWLPEQTYAMCNSIIDFANIKKSDRILDFGCAKGFTVRAFYEMGYDCYGTDISEYAINNAESIIKDRLTLDDFSIDENSLKNKKFDVIISKDVLEHISYENIHNLIKNLRHMTNKLFIIVPLAKNNLYIAPEYESDITHIIREDLEWWHKLFLECNFNTVVSSYQVKGIKDNWIHYPEANGFFLCQ